MKKLLSLLSILTISGSAIPTTIAANPYQKEENLNSYINYQQTNNLEKLNRNKRAAVVWDKPKNDGNTTLYYLDSYNLKKDQDYLNYLAYCYFYTRGFWYHDGNINPNLIRAYTGNDYSVLKSGLRTLLRNFSFKELKSKVKNNNKKKNLRRRCFRK